MTDPRPSPPSDPNAVQARLDQLFRNNARNDASDWATATLRRYVEDYRLLRGPAAPTEVAQ